MNEPSAVTTGDEIADDMDTQGRHTAQVKLGPLYSLKDHPPKLNLKSMQVARAKIRAALREAWLDKQVSYALVTDEIFPAFREFFPKNISDAALSTTLERHFCNVRLTEKYWDYISTRLSGNLYWLPFEPLTNIAALNHTQWAFLETVDAEYMRSKAGNIGAKFYYRVRTGFMAGQYFSKFMPLSYLPVYGENLGIGRARWNKHPRLYMGTNLIAFLMTADKAEQLQFDDHFSSGSCKDINRYLIKGRTEECIHGLNSQCWTCPRGVLDEEKTRQCKFATHRYSWVRRLCPRCTSVRWYYSHWSKDGPCIQCREAQFRGGI